MVETQGGVICISINKIVCKRICDPCRKIMRRKPFFLDQSQDCSGLDHHGSLPARVPHAFASLGAFKYHIIVDIKRWTIVEPSHSPGI